MTIERGEHTRILIVVNYDNSTICQNHFYFDEIVDAEM
jgi:hypothetical protein